MSKKIGFYGGSFDPIHFGHIALAIQIMEKKLDEVWFCPTSVSPFKIDKPPHSSGQDRFKMIQLAIEEIDGFSVIDLEIKKNKKVVYTIDTLKELQREGVDLHLILSEDSVEHFHKWKDPEEIVKIAPPLIGSRTGVFQNNYCPNSALGQILKKGFIKSHLMDISSTEIRDRLKKGLYCKHLSPGRTLDYIYKHQLYLY